MSDGGRVLVVGAGGLGSPVALALADSPLVSTLTLVDGDVVELSNLHRQILLGETDLGRRKVDAAAANLTARRPRADGDLRVVPLGERLTAANARALFAGHDVVIEGSDDLDTKFLVNDCAVALAVPAVIGGVVRFAGQLFTVWPGAGCYRCLFEEPPPPGTAVSCQQAGVLGPACGVVAGLLVAEALRILRRQPRHTGTLVTIDLLSLGQRPIAVARRRDCPACQAAARPGQILDSDSSRP